MNLRTLNLRDLETRAYANPSAEIGQELIRRLVDPSPLLEDVDVMDRRMDDACEAHAQYGYDDGQRDERALITEQICDMIIFRYADKIEANIIDELCEQINKDWPELPKPKMESV